MGWSILVSMASPCASLKTRLPTSRTVASTSPQRTLRVAPTRDFWLVQLPKEINLYNLPWLNHWTPQPITLFALNQVRQTITSQLRNQPQSGTQILSDYDFLGVGKPAALHNLHPFQHLCWPCARPFSLRALRIGWSELHVAGPLDRYTTCSCTENINWCIETHLDIEYLMIRTGRHWCFCLLLVLAVFHIKLWGWCHYMPLERETEKQQKPNS